VITPARLLHLASLLLLLLLAGCQAKECETSANCQDGTVCTESGICVEVSCNSSGECPIETWCNSDTGSCEPGCLGDRDCLPTNECDEGTRQCVQPGCRTTQLDCDLGQFCNALSGQCYDAGGYYCQQCESKFD
jgi:hypothetical protein